MAAPRQPLALASDPLQPGPLGSRLRMRFHLEMRRIMKTNFISLSTTLTLLLGLTFFSLNGPAQNAEMARHEPHMSAALGHLQQARAELEKATPNKGGYREHAMDLVDQAMQQVRDGEAYYSQHP
jgi:hypothetical protein